MRSVCGFGYRHIIGGTSVLIVARQAVRTGLTQLLGKLVFVEAVLGTLQKHCRGGIHASRRGNVPILLRISAKSYRVPDRLNASPTVRAKCIRKSPNTNLPLL